MRKRVAVREPDLDARRLLELTVERLGHDAVLVKPFKQAPLAAALTGVLAS